MFFPIKKYIQNKILLKLPIVPSTAPSTSLSSPRGFLFPQIAASTLMRYCSSFNSKIYSTARRLIQFINKPQCIHIPALILQTATVPYNPVQTSFHVSKKSLGFLGNLIHRKCFDCMLFVYLALPFMLRLNEGERQSYLWTLVVYC